MLLPLTDAVYSQHFTPLMKPQLFICLHFNMLLLLLSNGVYFISLPLLFIAAVFPTAIMKGLTIQTNKPFKMRS